MKHIAIAGFVVLSTLAPVASQTQAARPTTLAGRSTVYAPNGVIATSPADVASG